MNSTMKQLANQLRLCADLLIRLEDEVRPRRTFTSHDYISSAKRINVGIPGTTAEGKPCVRLATTEIAQVRVELADRRPPRAIYVGEYKHGYLPLTQLKCPKCSHEFEVSHMNWDLISCSECKTTLRKPEANLQRLGGSK
jgi:hypothetical protein